MSGHSKWANIKHKKDKMDSKRGKIFTKLGREIMIAVKMGGQDPASNSTLRDVIAKAKSNNMPNDNITRSIKKAAGESDGSNYEVIRYEGYGPSGIAVIVEALTDNRNRTAGDVRHYFDKFGGNLGTTGCVSFMFDKKGQIIVAKEDLDEDALTMAAIEAGAEDVASEDEYVEIITTPDDFSNIRETLEKAGYAFETADITMIPQTYITLPDAESRELMEKLIDHMEDNDDVQHIWHNWEEE